MTVSLPSLAAALLSLAIALPALGQSYPTKPVRLVITFPPGGPTDIAARLVAGKTGEGLGQPVIADNRAGGSGVIAADLVAKSPPDGYTLLLTPVSSFLTVAFVSKGLPYDVTRDFTPIVNATESIAGLVVANNVPARTLPELLALARKEPGKLTYSSAGIGTLFHLTGEMFKQAAGVDVVHVPYKGAAQALVDLSSGQISMTFSILAPVMSYVRSGKMRLIAVIDSQRVPSFPDVPTLSETLPNMQRLEGGLGFFGPAGLPRPVVQRVGAEIGKAVFAPEVKAKLEEFGFRVTVSTPEEFVASFARAHETYSRAVKLAGVKPE
jgi:tripartite-type tricarboxylate transporter receptor subunit TctC